MGTSGGHFGAICSGHVNMLFSSTPHPRRSPRTPSCHDYFAPFELAWCSAVASVCVGVLTSRLRYKKAPWTFRPVQSTQLDGRFLCRMRQNCDNSCIGRPFSTRSAAHPRHVRASPDLQLHSQEGWGCFFFSFAAAGAFSGRVGHRLAHADGARAVEDAGGHRGVGRAS